MAQPTSSLEETTLVSENPHGAVSVAKMAGNCYTVSLVTRIFFDYARFHANVPEGKEKGFKPADIARALRAKKPEDRKFDVYGYKSTARNDLLEPRSRKTTR